MDIQQLLHSLAERVSSNASVKTVYGEPVTHADRTVIPVARIRYAFGGGGGSGHNHGDVESRGGGGGGGRVSAEPRGAIEITPLGTRFIDFEDKRKMGIALALGFALGAALTALTAERGKSLP